MSPNCVRKLDSDCLLCALATEAAPPLWASRPRFQNVRLGLAWAQTTGRMTRGKVRTRRQGADQADEEDGKFFFLLGQDYLLEQLENHQK